MLHADNSPSWLTILRPPIFETVASSSGTQALGAELRGFPYDDTIRAETWYARGLSAGSRNKIV